MGELKEGLWEGRVDICGKLVSASIMGKSWSPTYMGGSRGRKVRRTSRREESVSRGYSLKLCRPVNVVMDHNLMHVTEALSRLPRFATSNSQLFQASPPKQISYLRDQRIHRDAFKSAQADRPASKVHLSYNGITRTEISSCSSSEARESEARKFEIRSGLADIRLRELAY